MYTYMSFGIIITTLYRLTGDGTCIITHNTQVAVSMSSPASLASQTVRVTVMMTVETVVTNTVWPGE